jgi:hypothetical protein
MSSVGTLAVTDNELWIAGLVVEGAIVALLLYRRAWRTLPVFCALCAWGLLSDAGNYVVQRYFAENYTTVYLVETIVDSILEFGVLVELAWSVLRPIRASLSRKTLVVVAIIIVAAGAAIWPFAGLHKLGLYPPAWQNLVHMQQTASILRVLFFLVLAGFSQLLSIGWRDRELQVATGLGFYSIISLAVTVLHSHQGMGQQYRNLNQYESAGYLLSVLYWVFAFATKEAERREFTPQMQSFLLAMAGTARSTRIGLSESRSSIVRKPEKR